MLTYPPEFSVLDRRRIDDALQAHRAPWVPLPDTPALVGLGYHQYASEAAAVLAVLAVFQVIVGRLLDHQEHQAGDTLRLWAHRLLGDTIAWAERLRPVPGRSTPDEFTTRVRLERDTRPWWLTFMKTIQPPIVKAPRQAPTKRSLFTRQAEWLAHQMLLAGNLTPKGLEVLGGPNGKTTKRLLSGSGSRRDDVFHKVVQGLNEANVRARRKVVLTIHDIPRD